MIEYSGNQSQGVVFMVCKNCGTQIFESDAFCPYCGTATNNDISSTVAVNAGYYENQTAPNAYADEAAGTEQPAAPLNYYTQPNYPAPRPKKKSAMPIIIGVLSVLLIAAVTALIFKEDIMAAFEKKPAKHNITNQSSSEISKAEGSYQFGIDGESTDAASNAAIQEETATAAAVAPTQQPSATQAATQKPTQAPTQKPATTSAQVSGGGLNSSDISAVVAFYNAAEKKTESGGAPKGRQTMQLNGDIKYDAAMGSLGPVLDPIITKAVDNNCGQTNSIPGKGALLASDVSSASATSKNGKTTIRLNIKNQTDGAYASDKNSSGPVARAIGTLGSADNIFNELDASINSSNKDSITIKYTNAYIECVVDEATGRIISGNWHYNVNINIGSASMKSGTISVSIKDINVNIDYEVEI